MQETSRYGFKRKKAFRAGNIQYLDYGGGYRTYTRDKIV